ncbi:DNA-binding protein [Streptomyces samsunensis]|uniref:helix-turn-helix domain-containing protein n=1 Tax=Streptomyces malaysiensis TaxID=92644 RepID=UPI001583B898|nr:helix-turn-helix domain-containing protein [Streptomyces samsunensis]NUH35321.1 DNA-binding protein [Streptomyces samsunensis]
MTRRHTYPEAAAELRVEESWLRRHIKKLPHSKKGRVVTFSDEDLTCIDAMFHHEPEQAPPLRAVGAHPLADLKPLPSRRAASA